VPTRSLNALYRVVDHVPDRSNTSWSAPSALMSVRRSGTGMQRTDAGLRRDRGYCEERSRKSISPESDQLQDCRLLPGWARRDLIDQHGALAQFLELGGKYVIGVL